MMHPGNTTVLRWGIMGTAKIAANAYLPAFRQCEGQDVLAVASRTRERATAFAREHGIAQAYGSYEALLEDPRIDAVYIPLPVALHHEWAIRCAQAGKHALVEKPLALNAEQAEAMIEAFRQRGLLLAEGMMYRYHPLNRRAYEWVREGMVGDVRHVRASFWAAAKDAKNIRMRPELGGGALLDLGCYCVSVMRWLTGAEPVDIQGVGVVKDVDVSVSGCLRFPGGQTGEFSCGLLSQFSCCYEIIGTEGRVSVPWGAMCAWPGTSFSLELRQGENQETISVPPANHYQLLLEDFKRAWQTGESMLIDVEDALQNMHVLDRLRGIVYAN